MPLERDAVLAVVRAQGGPTQRDPLGFEHGELPAYGGALTHHLVVLNTSYGQAEAALEVVDAVRAYPTLRLVIFVGAAGGISGLEIGDVVVSKGVYHFFEGRYDPGRFVPHGWCPPPDPEMLRYAGLLVSTERTPRSEWGAYLEGLAQRPPLVDSFPEFGERVRARPPTVSIGYIGTSSAVVNDPRMRDETVAVAPNCRVFENESYGLSRGAQRYGRQYLTIRAVSDLAGGAKSKEHDARDQPYAALVAASFLGAVLAKAPQLPPFPAARTPSDPRALPVGLFLDVDLTLTKDVIQKRFAEALGCGPEFEKIEAKWRKRSGSSVEEFNAEFIPLFARHGFTERKARELFPKVELQPWAEQLLRLESVEKYLVSSGPSYYIEPLAARYGIPLENVRCSKYWFGTGGGGARVLSGHEAVSDETKRMYVAERAVRHRITVGVGNDAVHDQAFLSECTIPILYLEKPWAGFMTTSSMETVFNVVERAVQHASSWGG